MKNWGLFIFFLLASGVVFQFNAGIIFEDWKKTRDPLAFFFLGSMLLAYGTAVAFTFHVCR